MARIVISPTNVVSYPEGGGHFWVFMQYAQALRRLGCEVHWLERVHESGDPRRDRRAVATFLKRLERFDLGGTAILYSEPAEAGERARTRRYLGIERDRAEAIFRQADLLLNFHYAIAPDLLARFRRTALVDIDPGLLQFWLAHGQLRVAPHDVYFSTGETVGLPDTSIPDCGLPWLRIRPPVCLECWPYVHGEDCVAMTTVSGWWGDEWITDGEILYENNKRVSFLEFVELPRRTNQVLELALCLGTGDPEDEVIPMREQGRSHRRGESRVMDYGGDAEDHALLESHGWRVRRAHEVAGSPEAYRAYIQGSRAEFSAVKPSCVRFRNAWVSDRSLCYLASGKPVVVQDTGASAFLPRRLGMFHFSTLDEIVDAIAAINADYEKHCRAAREIAETYFEGKAILEGVLHRSLETLPENRNQRREKSCES
ncbi:MAG: hypothetical protein V3T07_00745 [Myxococcota bacterium]